MGLSEDLKTVGTTISTGEAKSLRLEGLANEFTHNGEKVTYEIKIGKFGPYILTSLKDENGKDVMRSIPPTLFPGTFTDRDAEMLVFPEEQEGELLYGKYSLKKGRYGDYFERIEDGSTATWPKSLRTSAKNAPEDYIELLFSLPKILGKDERGNEAVLRVGPYGFYVQYDGKNIRVANPLTVTFEGILSEERSTDVTGECDGRSISLRRGRYGLYIKWGDENIKLPNEEKRNPEGLTLERIIEIARKSSEKAGDSVNAEREFREVDSVIPRLVSGRYGYYIKWGNENVALQKEEREHTDSLTDERVREIIEEYKAKPKTAKKSPRRRK